LREFLENKCGVPLEDAKFKIVLKYFDTSRDGKIDCNEFVGQLKKQAKIETNMDRYRPLFKGEKEPLNVSTMNALANAIALLMIKSDLTYDKLFKMIDTDNDKHITKLEFRALLKNQF
jgi:Ca2+-binding EF-hand superfamily protein